METQYPVQTIDLAALRHNVACIRQSLPDAVLLLAVVKADAYGHGMQQVARNALAAGASWLAVARVSEGVQLRQACIAAPILVLGASLEDELGAGIANDLTLALTTVQGVYAAQREALRQGKTCHFHLKLDTGMGRIGLRTEEDVHAVLASLHDCSAVHLTGVFTHFADADGVDEHYTRMQLERFQSLTRLLPQGILRHCANSAAIHRLPEATMDMVRAGISLYGYPPVETKMPLRPVMDWRTVVTYVKEVQPGDKISYGCTFTAAKAMHLATIACGYGDGYHRSASQKASVLLHGKRCPVVGRICMDQMMVDVSEVENVQSGDEVILIGTSGKETITAEDVAAWCGTISYEVLLAATGRVHRQWIHDCNE